MALKILKALKKKHSIKLMIHSRMAGYEEPRSHNPLHASDLMKDLEFCPREHAFLDMDLAKKKGSYIGTSLQITFQHGRDMENRLRNEWLRDVAVGYWKCGVCSHKHSTFGNAPKIKCPTCGWGHQWNYDEVRFASPHSGIEGGLDLLVDVGEPKLRILEVKSMDKDMFKDLKAPLAEHRFRTSLYLRLAEESHLSISDRVNISEAHIIYVSKSFGFKDESMKEAGISDAPFSPFKEFVIPRDDTLVTTSVNKSVVLKAWRDKPEIGLPCQICHNGLTKRAQQCTANFPCWNGKHPAVITWIENGTSRHPGKVVVK